MNKTYLLLGGNLGDRLSLLSQAKNEIEEQIGAVIDESSVYETSPWGFIADQDFLNKVLIVLTKLTPNKLLETCLDIEVKLGRIRSGQGYSSRTMDIDILFYNNQIINEFNLTIPHQHLHERRFVLEPLVELQPDLIHPTVNKSLKTLLQDCTDQSEVKKL